jgi:O-antigen/teichoic acid export membrane protein
VIIGLQRFDVSAQIEIVIGGLRAIAIYVALKASLGLIGLALTVLVASVVRMAILAIVARRLYPELRITRLSWDRTWSKRIFAFSLYSTLITFSTTVILYTDSLVISAFLPAAQITFFSIASSLTDYARTLVRGISTTMTPRTSAMENDGTEVMAGVVVRVLRMSTVLILPVAVTFLIRGPSFIGLWMGAEYAATSGIVLRILTVSMVFYAASQVLGSSLLGLSSHKRLVPMFLAEAATNLLLSIYLVRRIGLPGIAWGTTIPSVVSSLVLFPLIARRVLGIPVLRYYREAWVRPSLAMIPFVAGSIAVERYWPGDNLAVYFCGVLLVLPLAVLGAWLVALSGPEREQLAAQMRGLRRLPALWRSTHP